MGNGLSGDMMNNGRPVAAMGGMGMGMGSGLNGGMGAGAGMGGMGGMNAPGSPRLPGMGHMGNASMNGMSPRVNRDAASQGSMNMGSLADALSNLQGTSTAQRPASNQMSEMVCGLHDRPMIAPAWGHTADLICCALGCLAHCGLLRKSQIRRICTL